MTDPLIPIRGRSQERSLPRSAKALVTAGLMLAGLTHCPDVNPFINVEFKEGPKSRPGLGSP
jgi:hypothetical protein